MTLRESQVLFMRLLPKLIIEIFNAGYEVTAGECYRTPEQAALNASRGIGIKNSAHCNRLAVDLNLFKYGAYLDGGDDHKQFGEFWETLNPACKWGGRFSKPDPNHYSIEYGGVK